MRSIVRACLAGVVMIGALVAVSVGSSAESASRIIDRTVVCQMPGEGFPDSTQFMTVSAQAGNERHGSPPLMSASNGPSFQLRALVSTGPYGRRLTGSVVFSRTECTTTSLRIPLSARGLKGGPSTSVPDSYRCDVPATVLIRVRAEFKRPTGFSRDPDSPTTIVASGQIAVGYLAITTLRGRKPIVFASVNEATGKARLFVAPSRCRAER